MLDKISLVTGASRGIGQAIATQLAREGYKVYGTSTSEKGAQSISELGQSLSLPLQGLACNVNDQESIEKLSEAIDQPISILVSNAGITRDNLMLRLSLEDWQSVIDTNLTSAYRLAKLVLRGMIKQRWGRIIHISSVVGVTGNPGQCNYSASKAGLIGFTKSLALEVAPRNITVNAVSPGFIATDMTEALSDKQSDQILEKIPMGRLGQVEEIANLVAFLASAKAGYITGENIMINGGMA